MKIQSWTEEINNYTKSKMKIHIISKIEIIIIMR